MIGPRLRPVASPSWEVVTHQSVDVAASPLEVDEFDFTPRQRSASPPADSHSYTYVFDLPSTPKNASGMPSTLDARRAVRSAQARTLEQVSSGLGNVVLSRERWSLTILRRGNAYRIQVIYSAVPVPVPTPKAAADPPYLMVIDSRAW